MIQSYVGEGKGKTTAAIGAAIRMAGYNKKVLFAQFLKGGKSGEIHALNSLQCVDVYRNKKKYGFVKEITDNEKRMLTDEQNDLLMKIIKSMKSKKYSMIILDEIFDAIVLETADAILLKEIIKLAKEVNIELVMTGHQVIDWIIMESDYCSMINKIKHPYDNGILAREGIEY